MNVKRRDGQVFVTGFDDRERTEVRRLARPSFTANERQRGLVAFLEKRGFPVGEDETVYVWA